MVRIYEKLRKIWPQYKLAQLIGSIKDDIEKDLNEIFMGSRNMLVKLRLLMDTTF